MTSHLPVRTIIASTGKPSSNAAGPIEINPQPMRLRSYLKLTTKPSSSYDCKTKNAGGSRNTEFFTIEGNKIKESRGLLWFCPEGTSVNRRTIGCRGVTLSTTLPTALEAQLDCPRT